MWYLTMVKSIGDKNDIRIASSFNLYNPIYKKYFHIVMYEVGIVDISDDTLLLYEPIDLFDIYNYTDKFDSNTEIKALQFILKHIYKKLVGL